jgi:multidrug efflux pump subunit AcrA (membrane-fusion protein)
MMQQRTESDSARRGKRRAQPENPETDVQAEETERSKAEAPASKPARTPQSPDGASQATPAKRGGRLLLIVLAVIAVAAIGYRYMVAPQGEQTQAAAPPPPTVTVAKPVVREMREWRDFTGQFAAPESVEIRARVSGYLESINFTDGQLVKKGDLLFVIEPRPYEIELDSAKAQLAQAEAQLALANVQLDRTSKLLKND